MSKHTLCSDVGFLTIFPLHRRLGLSVQSLSACSISSILGKAFMRLIFEKLQETSPVMFSQSSPQDKGFLSDEKHLTHTIMSVKTIF